MLFFIITYFPIWRQIEGFTKYWGIKQVIFVDFRYSLPNLSQTIQKVRQFSHCPVFITSPGSNSFCKARLLATICQLHNTLFCSLSIGKWRNDISNGFLNCFLKCLSDFLSCFLYDILSVFITADGNFSKNFPSAALDFYLILYSKTTAIPRSRLPGYSPSHRQSHTAPVR